MSNDAFNIVAVLAYLCVIDFIGIVLLVFWPHLGYGYAMIAYSVAMLLLLIKFLKLRQSNELLQMVER